MTQNSPKVGSQNHDLLNLLYRYGIWYLVKEHVQRVPNIYGKGGKKVSNAELRPAEVDLIFQRKNHVLYTYMSNTHIRNPECVMIAWVPQPQAPTPPHPPKKQLTN